MKGGDRGGRRPRSPSATLARLGPLAASLALRPEQLSGWTAAELEEVLAVIRRAGAAFEAEIDRRDDARELAEDIEAQMIAARE